MPPRDPFGAPATFDPVVDISRRRILTAVPGLVVLAGGISCGDDDGEAAAARAAPGTSTPARMGPRTIDTAMGRVEIPAEPTRVVCVINYAMNTLFSLGFAPSGVPDNFATAVLPSEASMYAAAPKVGPWNEINVEKVAALKPDLILGLDGDWNTPLYDRLKPIAPTALLPIAGTSDWEKLGAAFAEAIGRGKELAALKQRYTERLASIRANYGTALNKTKWVIANGFQAGWVVWYPDSSGGQVLGGAGVSFSSAAAGKTGNYAAMSLEQLGAIGDADVVLVTGDYTKKVSTASQALFDQPLFKALPAAKANRVFPISNLFPMSYTQAIALLDEVEAIVRTLG